MTYGLQIDNPSGTLVMSSDLPTYSYIGQPSLITSASKTSGLSTPYLYRITMPSTTAIPLVAAKLVSGVVVDIGGVGRTSGSTTQWDIQVYCANTSGANAYSTITYTTPTLYVFSPPGSSSGGYGVQMFDSSGNITADLSKPPLWLRQFISFPLVSGSQAIGGTWTNVAQLEGDSQTWDNSTYTVPAAFGSGNGYCSQNNPGTGNVMNEYSYGLSVSGTSIQRVRYWVDNQSPSVTYNSTYWTTTYNIEPTTIILMDTSVLL